MPIESEYFDNPKIVVNCSKCTSCDIVSLFSSATSEGWIYWIWDSEEESELKLRGWAIIDDIPICPKCQKKES
jgi:hypothetical protein